VNKITRSDWLGLKPRPYTTYGMLKLRKFVKWKNQNSPWNRWESPSKLFRGLRDSFRGNYVTISDFM